MRIPNPPESSALMATSRSFGNYDLAAALADLIDNSIKARANSVSIDFLPQNNDVMVTIRDDGYGMDGDTLINAMRPASAHPEEDRSSHDLGRFGWGLKSASLSQARVMTVISWQGNEVSAARWNIDDIDDWAMDFFGGEDALKELSRPPGTPTGTEVIWQKTDRLVQDVGDDHFHESLTQLISQARDHLALVFHRYLSGDGGSRLSISINGTQLQAIDPFMRSHPATQAMDAEKIVMSNGSTIEVKPYVLPHFSKLTQEEQGRLGGAEGMVRNQGFYVYRNRRLIIHGTWFRLMPHRELSQLTRVSVDIPNTVDHDWRITVDKSGAQLPIELKRRLREVVRQFNKRSLRVHRKKGVSIDRPDREPVWHREVKNGKIRYVVNRDHPIVSGLFDEIGELGEIDSLSSMLTLLESYFPTESFVQDAGREDSKLNQPPTSTEEYDSLLKQCWLNYLRSSDGSYKVDDFLTYLRSIEPFASHWRYTEDYVRNNASTYIGLSDGL